MTREPTARLDSASSPKLDPFARLQAALASAEPGGPFGGVGCHFWTRPTLGVPVEQLEAFGLVRIIRQRVPICEEHGCPAIADCADRALFAERGSGIGWRKFRLTPLGTQAAADRSMLAGQIAEQPVAARIMAVLGASDASVSWLDLYWCLLEPELAALDETGQRPSPALSRPAVRFHLDLLVAAGLLSEDAASGRLIRRDRLRGPGV